MSLMQRLMAQRLAKAANETPAPTAPTGSTSTPVHATPLQHRHRLRAELAGCGKEKRRPVDGVEFLPEIADITPPVFLSEMPPAAVPTSAPAAPAPRASGSCKAINADTGRQCALPGGHAGEHRHGRTSFTRVAAPGQTSFARRDALEAAATSRLSSPFTTSQGEP